MPHSRRQLQMYNGHSFWYKIFLLLIWRYAEGKVNYVMNKMSKLYKKTKINSGQIMTVKPPKNSWNFNRRKGKSWKTKKKWKRKQQLERFSQTSTRRLVSSRKANLKKKSLKLKELKTNGTKSRDWLWRCFSKKNKLRNLTCKKREKRRIKTK